LEQFVTAPVVTIDGLVVRLSPRFQLSADRLVIGQGITAVVGSNGSGKSTLLRTIATVQTPSSGAITIAGRATERPDDRVIVRRSLGYLPQDDSTPPRLSVFDHVDLIAVMRELSTTSRARRAAVARSLDELELLDLAGERCGKLSGGQRRRVAICAAMSGRPSLLVLDEPDAHLDDHHRARLGRLLRDRAADTTIVIATHDRAWVTDLADRTVAVQDGVVSPAT